MLIYARRESGASASSSVAPVPEPPLAARERVANLNKSHDDACVAYLERSICKLCIVESLTCYSGKRI